jgi:hypothetical protein
MKIAKKVNEGVGSLIGTTWGATVDEVKTNLLTYGFEMATKPAAERMQAASRANQAPLPAGDDIVAATVAFVDAVLADHDESDTPFIGDDAYIHESKLDEAAALRAEFARMEDKEIAMCLWQFAAEETRLRHAYFVSSPAHTIEENLVQFVAVCAICDKPQYETPGGVSCTEGHFGADSLPISGPTQPNGEPITQVRSILDDDLVKKKVYIDAAIRDGLLTQAVVARDGAAGAWLKLQFSAPAGWFKKINAEYGITERIQTNCPFHDDKNASMVIENGKYYCNKCHAGGGVAGSEIVKAITSKLATETVPEINISDTVVALDRLGYHVTLPIFAALVPDERRAIAAWVGAGADRKTMPRSLLAEIERGELLPPCPGCGKNYDLKRKGPDTYRCINCNIVFGADGKIVESLSGLKRTPKDDPGPAVAGCAACDQGKPFTNGTEYLHTGVGKLCTVAKPIIETADALPVAGKEKKKRQCRNCWELGHNTKTCTNPKREKPGTSAPAAIASLDAWIAAAAKARSVVEIEDEEAP